MASPAPDAPELYPLFLKLAGRRVLVVGGGNVANAKLEALIGAGASITVVAPRILAEVASRPVRCIQRAFRPSDLAGVWYVVAAATPEANQRVAFEASKRRLFVNAVDDPKRASAYLGGVVRKGGVTLAISTAGRVAALAGMLREAFEALLPDEIESWVMAGQSARATWQAQGVPHDERRPRLLSVLNALYGDRESVEAGRYRGVKANKNKSL